MNKSGASGQSTKQFIFIVILNYVQRKKGTLFKALKGVMPSNNVPSEYVAHKSNFVFSKDLPSLQKELPVNPSLVETNDAYI